MSSKDTNEFKNFKYFDKVKPSCKLYIFTKINYQTDENQTKTED